jgi:hypothetical protein
MGLGRDKHPKINKPTSDNLLSTTASRPIKVTDAAASVQKVSRVDQKSVESLKIVKVTTVVVVMTIFCRSKCNLRNAILQNSEKLELNLKKLELNQNRLCLNSNEKHPRQATKPKKGARGT